MTGNTDRINGGALASKPAGGKRKPLLIGIALFFLLVAAASTSLYELVFSKREKTDDAYVGGNQVMLTSQIAGTVVSIHADNTQLVRAGQEIIRLDATDADLAVLRAKTQLAETVRQVRQQFLRVNEYTALVAKRELELAKAKEDYNRRFPLLADRSIAIEDVEHARNTVLITEAELNIARKQAAAARAFTAGTTVERHPSVQKARMDFKLAYITARRHAIVAPVTGYVAGRSVQVGQHITPGMMLLAIVPLDQLWVDANFKEVELRNLRIGQRASIVSDLYGSSVVYHGTVIGMAAGTGSSFSLLPPQNASGNWIKVVQRVPVRIALDPQELAAHPLRIGLSTIVTVKTENRNGPVLAMVPNTQPLYKTAVYANLAIGADRIADAVIRENTGSKSGFAKDPTEAPDQD